MEKYKVTGKFFLVGECKGIERILDDQIFINKIVEVDGKGKHKEAFKIAVESRLKKLKKKHGRLFDCEKMELIEKSVLVESL